MPRLDPLLVPILDVSQETVELMGEPRPALAGGAPAHEQGTDPDGPRLLTGVRLVVHNPAPVGALGETTTSFAIGGETLNEAAKSVVGTFPQHGYQVPDWVASDDERLAQVVAEHWSTKGHAVKVRGLDDAGA